MEFLAFYAMIAVTIVVGFRAYVLGLDSTERRPIPPIPTPPDPIEVAFLRAGPGEVVRTVAVAMAERGIIRIRMSGLERATPTTVSRENAIENAIFDGLATNRTFPELSKAISPRVLAALEPMAARLRADGLLRPTSDARAAKLGGALALFALVVVTYALARHPTATDTILGVAILLAAAISIWRTARIGRTTDRGRRYLAQLAAGFPAPSLLENVGDPSPVPIPANGFLAAPLLVGLYGVASLRDTPYASATTGLRAARGRSSGDGSVGCGSCGWTSGGSCCGPSGCSSGGCSSGGCGGGCGGCGG